MRIIIIGAGKIGYHIADFLSHEKHDVIVIELNEERAHSLEETLDVQIINGSGTSGQTLEQAGIREASMLIAVTESDEVNMISCILAKQYGVEKTVARVRNPEYVEEDYVHEGVFAGIDLIINPELVTAKEIVKHIDAPEALDVVYYAHGKIQMLELQMTPDAFAVNKKIRDLQMNFSFLIIAILRNGKMLIPRGDDYVLPDDIIFLMAKTKEMAKVERLLGKERMITQRVMILGADLTGLHLARLLEERKISVKIIEKQYKRCLEVTHNLQNTLVFHGDGTDIDLLKAEGAGDTDIFVCLTDDDKLNLLVGLIAKHLGTKRAIAQVRRSDFVDLMEKVGIDIGISPRLLTANAILRFIKRGSNVVSVTLLGEERAEMMELLVSAESKVANKKIRDMNFPKGAIIGSICRKNNVIIAGGEDILRPGDMVTVFALPRAMQTVEQYFDI